MRNGKKMMDIFPGAIAKVCKNKGFTHIEMRQNNKWIGDFSMNWWLSEYKEPTTEIIGESEG